MPFNSISFVFYFLIFTVLYYCLRDIRFKLIFLLIGSYSFFIYNNIFNLFFLLSITWVTYIVVNKFIHAHKRFLLFIGICFILIQLLFAKYSNILFGNYLINSTLEFSYFSFYILPIGISFYSLQAISLLVDTRSGKYKGDTSFITVSQYLSFFPQSISGPIHRANELIPQFSASKSFIAANLIIGLKTMLWGYFCKLIVADKIALIVSPIFKFYQEQDGLSISIASLLYSFQIYFDFWGYSLIAIGVGRVLGFRININFQNPYSARSFKNFWHRWHITLSKWMRDYIYIPLGGRRQKNSLLFSLSILITFLISGFWHGVTLNFILWGSVHAFLYLAEELYSRQFSFRKLQCCKWIIKPIKTIAFFILISFTWLIFRTYDLHALTFMLKSITSFSDWTALNTFNHYFSTTNLYYLAIIVTAILLSHTKLRTRYTETVPTNLTQTISESIITCICIVLVILLGDIGGQEFLYFNF